MASRSAFIILIIEVVGHGVYSIFYWCKWRKEPRKVKKLSEIELEKLKIDKQ